MSVTPEDIRELVQELNSLGEHTRIEAKAGSDVGKSVMETVCSFSNEPGLDGGHILLGVARTSPLDLFDQVRYEIIGVPNPERISEDLAAQCASSFNRPLRPRITPVTVDQRTVVHVRVDEVAPGEKPIYLKAKKLPEGAYRRIGSSDVVCTEDDLQVLYDSRRRAPYDRDIVVDSTIDDLDPAAIAEYRAIRREISPAAEELRYDDEDLLHALGAVRDDDGKRRPTVAGILLFGTPIALRRYFGMMRIDYIRVPGNEWVSKPDERFASIDIRAPLMRAVQRAEAAIIDDLPKAFVLPEGSLRRRDVHSLPRKVLREALVNAVMHRDYRVHGAVQIIRYSNRIEIQNPGFSLKSPDRLGEPGSETRNPTIAAVFHETNLAETKGTGIRAMRRLMREADLVPPTFESDRKGNRFIALLLLHHFLGAADLRWIDRLGVPNLSGDEKLALVFVREVGAIDNPAYRDLAGIDSLRASASLRHLCEAGLLEKHGQSTATYYQPTSAFLATLSGETTNAADARTTRDSEQAGSLAESGMAVDESGMAATQSGMAVTQSGMGGARSGMRDPVPGTREYAEKAYRAWLDMLAELPKELRDDVAAVGLKSTDDQMRDVLTRLCAFRPYSAEELARIVRRNPNYLRERHIREMVKRGTLRYTIPDMPKHPKQTYFASAS